MGAFYICGSIGVKCLFTPAIAKDSFLSQLCLIKNDLYKSDTVTKKIISSPTASMNQNYYQRSKLVYYYIYLWIIWCVS